LKKFILTQDKIERNQSENFEDQPFFKQGTKDDLPIKSESFMEVLSSSALEKQIQNLPDQCEDFKENKDSIWL